MAQKHTSNCGTMSNGKTGEMKAARKGTSQAALSADGPVKQVLPPCTKVNGTLPLSLNLHIQRRKLPTINEA